MHNFDMGWSAVDSSLCSGCGQLTASAKWHMPSVQRCGDQGVAPSACHCHLFEMGVIDQSLGYFSSGVKV